MSRPLSERKEFLESVITEVPNSLEIVRGVKCHSVEEVLAVFEDSIQKQEEGVIIKDSQSTYLPNSRSTSHWVKLKSDYIDQLGDTLDLVIIGGYFGERHRVGLFTG
jgi:DNA ligase 4